MAISAVIVRDVDWEILRKSVSQFAKDSRTMSTSPILLVLVSGGSIYEIMRSSYGT